MIKSLTRRGATLLQTTGNSTSGITTLPSISSAPVVASSVVFRRTLTYIGTRVGDRQVQGSNN